MSVCLITAPIVTEFADPEEIASQAVSQTARDPQLGVLSLAATLESSGEPVWIVDLNKLYMESAAAYGSPALDFGELAAETIAINECSVFGFSSICSSYPLTIRIAKALKNLRPESTILLGGPQASVVDRQPFPRSHLLILFCVEKPSARCLYCSSNYAVIEALRPFLG